MTREEAIKEAYGIPVTKAQHEALQFLIPELAESEDERIRKWLLAQLQETRRNEAIPSSVSSVAKAITWLEKQKEQKPNPYILCESIKDKIKTYIANHFITDKVVKTDVASIVHAMEEGVKFGMAEQKPAEFTSNQFDGITYGMSGHSTDKPAEWNEEDIKKIRSEEYTKGFNDAAFGGKVKEWSEEDENNLHRVIRVLEDNDSDWKELSDWLKSLRPSWKPSEEQMKALQNAVALTACDKELARLYNQLMKLKGE